MATHTQLPIYKVAYDLLDVVTDLVKNMQRDFKRSIGDKIASECIEITVLVFRANVAQDKGPHLLELLERAAKAAGMRAGNRPGEYAWHPGLGCLSTLDERNREVPWNPLTDSGDALRLAVKLRLTIQHDFDRVDVCKDGGIHAAEYIYQKPPSDIYAATRRAIVRAAAAMAVEGGQYAMTPIYVSELIGEELDAQVIRALPDWPWLDDAPMPSSDPADGLPLIEAFKVQLVPVYDNAEIFQHWLASPGLSRETWATSSFATRGDTALVAACRCIVANILGDILDEHTDRNVERKAAAVAAAPAGYTVTRMGDGTIMATNGKVSATLWWTDQTWVDDHRLATSNNSGDCGEWE